MRITGSGSFGGSFAAQAAKAYGVKPPCAALPQADSPSPSSNVRGLVAANVTQPVSFESAQSNPLLRSASASAALQMYTRAADKIEAAVGVALGRMVDLKG